MTTIGDQGLGGRELRATTPSALVASAEDVLEHRAEAYVALDHDWRVVYMRLDAELALDPTASLCGYHRERLTLSGRWPERIYRLADDSPLLELPPEGG